MKVLPGIFATDTIIRFGNDSDLKYQQSLGIEIACINVPEDELLSGGCQGQQHCINHLNVQIDD